ncbi:MAG: 1,4-dihydroxy-6-naphthoate synthase [Ferruginibacter sp.]
MSNTIQIGFSPCPNDSFIFDALVHKKIDTGNLNFEAVLADVETLNEWAMKKKLAVTKLSYGVLPLVLNNYRLLNSGSALGRGVGPLLIKGKTDNEIHVEENLIAIPGEHTTAHLLFSLAYPEAKHKIFLRYDVIENFVQDGKGYGVIIHENRFTYQDKGLIKIQDLGDFWEQQTGQPIPLGGIVVDKKMDKSLKLQIDDLIKQSIEYSFSNYPLLSDYIKENAQEMSEDVMRKHIDLYVNKYSFHLGDEGKRAVKKLIDVYAGMHNILITSETVFK